MLDKKHKRRLVNSNGETIAEFPISNFEWVTVNEKILAEFIVDVPFIFAFDDYEFRCKNNINTREDKIKYVKEWLESEAD